VIATPTDLYVKELRHGKARGLRGHDYARLIPAGVMGKGRKGDKPALEVCHLGLYLNAGGGVRDYWGEAWVRWGYVA
jgi:hypothetical protein